MIVIFNHPLFARWSRAVVSDWPDLSASDYAHDGPRVGTLQLLQEAAAARHLFFPNPVL